MGVRGLGGRGWGDAGVALEEENFRMALRMAGGSSMMRMRRAERI